MCTGAGLVVVVDQTSVGTDGWQMVDSSLEAPSLYGQLLVCLGRVWHVKVDADAARKLGRGQPRSRDAEPALVLHAAALVLLVDNRPKPRAIRTVSSTDPESL